MSLDNRKFLKYVDLEILKTLLTMNIGTETKEATIIKSKIYRREHSKWVIVGKYLFTFKFLHGREFPRRAVGGRSC